MSDSDNRMTDIHRLMDDLAETKEDNAQLRQQLAEVTVLLSQAKAIVVQQKSEIHRLRPAVMESEILEEREDRLITRMCEAGDMKDTITHLAQQLAEARLRASLAEHRVECFSYFIGGVNCKECDFLEKASREAAETAQAEKGRTDHETKSAN